MTDDKGAWLIGVVYAVTTVLIVLGYLAVFMWFWGILK